MPLPTRRLIAPAVFFLALMVARPAVADVQQFLGRTITDVRVEIAGVPLLKETVLELVETRIGEPLTMRGVRATIDHLVGLGRFEDVRVYATTAEPGVALVWQLIPVRRITTIAVTGNPELSRDAIRAELTERFGAQPSA